MTTTGRPVHLIGPGEIGAAMVARLLAAGHDLTVHARRPGVADHLGAPVVVDDLGAVAPADVVLVVVLTDAEAARAGAAAVAAMRPGSVLVLHTTGSPRTAQTLAAAGAQRGVAVVDAPVSGTPAAVRSGAITLLVGGAGPVVEHVRPVLAAYGDPILHLGPLGAGQTLKLVNNLLLAAHVQLGAEAVRIGERLGIDRSVLATALAHCSGASRGLAMAATADPARDVLADLHHFLGKDVTVATAVATELGVDLGYLGEVARHGPAHFGKAAPSSPG